MKTPMTVRIMSFDALTFATLFALIVRRQAKLTP